MQFKVICIVKASKEKYVKYHVTNLLNFTAFLDRVYPAWLFFNVFNPATNKQVTSFTK